jgi:hypothetical protein
MINQTPVYGFVSGECPSVASQQIKEQGLGNGSQDLTQFYVQLSFYLVLPVCLSADWRKYVFW